MSEIYRFRTPQKIDLKVMPLKTVKSILCFATFFLSNSVVADAYKCIKDGRPVYQGTPCEVNSNKGKLDIKEQTPEQKAMAMEKLQEIRREYDALEATKQNATGNVTPLRNDIQPPVATPESDQAQ